MAQVSWSAVEHAENLPYSPRLTFPCWILAQELPRRCSCPQTESISEPSVSWFSMSLDGIARHCVASTMHLHTAFEGVGGRFSGACQFADSLGQDDDDLYVLIFTATVKVSKPSTTPSRSLDLPRHLLFSPILPWNCQSRQVSWWIHRGVIARVRTDSLR